MRNTIHKWYILPCFGNLKICLSLLTSKIRVHYVTLPLTLHSRVIFCVVLFPSACWSRQTKRYLINLHLNHNKTQPRTWGFNGTFEVRDLGGIGVAPHLGFQVQLYKHSTTLSPHTPSLPPPARHSANTSSPVTSEPMNTTQKKIVSFFNLIKFRTENKNLIFDLSPLTFFGFLKWGHWVNDWMLV